MKTNYKDVMKLILLRRGMTFSMYARMVGMSKQALNSRLSAKSIGLAIAIEMANKMDCKIVVMPKSGRLPKDAYELKIEDEEE